MKYLITGGAGFIGSSLVRELLAAGNVVVVVDSLVNATEPEPENNLEFIEGDLTDQRTLKRFPHVDIVYHLASQASGQVSWEDPAYDVQANVLATMNILSWSAASAVKKFIFTSTMGVYENSAPLTGVSESFNLKPASVYGVNKLACEHYIRLFAEAGLETTIFRLFNVYGPGQNLDNSKQGMVNIYLSQMIRQRKIVVKGAAERYRDFVYVSDVVEALLLGLKDEAINKTFNVCTGAKTEVRSLLAELIATSTLEKEEIEICYEGETPKDIYGCYGSNKKITEVLGWHPKIDLSTGLKNMNDWARSVEENKL